MILTGNEIRELIEKEQLISNFIDLKTQIQPAGFDVTVKAIKIAVSSKPAVIGFGYKNIPIFTNLKHTNNLFQGETYVLVTNEKLKMPNYLTAKAYPRSTFTRIGTMFSAPAIIDAGYEGNLHFAMTPATQIVLEKNARIVQLVFHKHNPTFKYNGSYQQGEKRNDSK